MRIEGVLWGLSEEEIQQPKLIVSTQKTVPPQRNDRGVYPGRGRTRGKFLLLKPRRMFCGGEQGKQNRGTDKKAIRGDG